VGTVIFLMQIAVCAIVHDNENVQAFLKFLDMMPSIVKTALGGEMLQAGNTAGLIAIGYQHPLVLLLFMLFAVGAPTVLLTREVQQGTMELILSRPATKSQVYLCASIVTLIGMFTLTMIMFLGTVAATNIYDFGEPIPLDLFFRIAINGGLLASAAGAIALLSAGAFGGHNMSVGATVAFLVINYFMWMVAQWWPPMSFLRSATLFNYVDGVQLFAGWPLRDMGVLATVILVAAVTGGILWKSRDLPL
jgi:ABC-2 type transport system permease protein